MTPATPVLPNAPNLNEVTFAEHQPEYLTLPSVKLGADGCVVTRWKLTWRERFTVLLHGNLWLSLLTFNRPLQPVKLDISEPLYLLEGRK